MRALCFEGTKKVGVQNVPDPALLGPKDCIVRVTATSICGSDLHIFGGFIPSVEHGDILGHEFMGEVVDVGRDVKNLRTGDRVVVPSTIGCGQCFYCRREEWSLCDNSNPNAAVPEALYGYAPCGIFGYSHAFGGYAGSFAEYVRVPFADVGPMKVPQGFDDDRLLFLSDAIPCGYMAADMCNIKRGDTVAVWGAGAVGLFAMKMAKLLGAERVIAIDRFPDRLELAENFAGAEAVNYAGVDDVVEELRVLTFGRGPDACIDAVGMESHHFGPIGAYDRTLQAARLEDRPHALRQSIRACRKGGTVSIVGMYAGLVDKMPMGAAMNKALTLRMGMTHGQKYARLALDRVIRGEIDPGVMATHHMTLEQGKDAFLQFRDKRDGCIRVVLRP